MKIYSPIILIIFLVFNIFLLADQVYAQTEVSGNITSDTTWTLENSPYLATQNVQVLEGVTLKIEPGVVVNLQNTALVVGGKLVAIGNESQKITFHGGTVTFTDKSIDAVTDQNNNYINGSAIQYSILEAGKTIGLNITNASPLISHNIIRNYIPGSAGGYAIHLHHSNSVIVDNLIENNSITAINIYFSSAKILNNTITNNLTGFEISGGDSLISNNTIQNINTEFYLNFFANPTIEYNNFLNKNEKGSVIWLAQTSDVIMNNNYWDAIADSKINDLIHDYYDSVSLGKVNYEPYALKKLNFDGTDKFSQPPTCTSWTYSNWSVCSSNGQQTRTITSSSPNGCSGGSPVLTQSCTYTPPTCTSWTYSDWGTCSNGQQTRTILSAQPATCSSGNPILSRSCNSIPVCVENDWNFTLSPKICPSSGQQTKSWNKTGQCQKGIAHPAQEIISCNYQVPTCTNFTYGAWGECSLNEVQSRKLLTSSPNNCTGGNPITNQSCEKKPETKNTDTISNNSQSKNNNIEINNGKVLGDVDKKNAVVIEEKTLITKIDNSLSKRVSGNILLQVEKNGEGWYVYPDNKKKYYLGRPADAFSIMRNLGLGIKHSELNIYLNSKFPSRLSGKILLDVEQKGEAYYINPNNLKGYYLSRPADAFRIMRELGLGITNDDIRKIDVGETE